MKINYREPRSMSQLSTLFSELRSMGLGQVTELIEKQHNEIERLRFAIQNLHDVWIGTGGTVKVDTETGMPLTCEKCGEYIRYEHLCS